MEKFCYMKCPVRHHTSRRVSH
ncbi:hypothetical protein J4U88_05390 [Escherichia coli]